MDTACIPFLELVRMYILCNYVATISVVLNTGISLLCTYLTFDFLSLNFHTDIFKVTMNATKFQGWGKEDGDFYTRVINSPRKFNVIRWKEPGLIHLWHPKVWLYAMYLVSLSPFVFKY